MIYFWETSAGTVTIRPFKDRWCVFYNDENMGSYHSPRAAADDVSGGHTMTPSNGVDFADLGIPADLPEWKTRRS